MHAKLAIPSSLLNSIQYRIHGLVHAANLEWQQDFRNQDAEKLACMFKAVSTASVLSLSCSLTDLDAIGRPGVPCPQKLHPSLGHGRDREPLHAEHPASRARQGNTAP